MNILIIGGAGYIGSVIVEKLLKENNCVVIYDNLSTGYDPTLSNPKAKFIKGDMLDTNFLVRTIKANKIEIVIALAAKIIVSQSMEQPIEYFENNICGIISILKAMNLTNTKKIIFSSSAAVYGQCSNKSICEDDSKMPINPYGQSKLTCEWLIENAKKAYGINYVIFRFFNVAGASDSLKNGLRNNSSALLIPCINKAIIEHKNPLIFGNDYKTKDGTCIRDYIHVEDLANAHVFALDYLNSDKFNIFNLGSGLGYSVLEIMNQTKQILNVNFSIEIKSRRKGDPDILVTNNSKILKELKWVPIKNIKDMIKSDYEFRIANVSK